MLRIERQGGRERTVAARAPDISVAVPSLFTVSPDRADLLDRVVCSSIIACLIGAFYLGLAGNIFQPLIDSIVRAHFSKAILRPSMLWALVGTLFFVFRTVLWLRYRPIPSTTRKNAPSLTVIIPAYNEGAMVEKAIYSVLSADYPRGRLEVFVVDDGSTDDTWHYIASAAKANPGVITPVRFPKNKGKRAALYEGFRRARGEVVVTVDSDSIVEPDALLAITGPFRDKRVGAVAGKVMAHNLAEGLIPRMLHVRFVLSFDFLRAVQSTYRTVYCCPGALSAYRISVLRSIVDEWMDQKFLGVPCTYGEDRALTNFILSAGYDSIYQRSARVRTVVPSSYAKLCKMYLRWDRSYVREVIHFSRIVWRRPLGPLLISVVDMVITNLRYPVGWVSLVLLITLSVNDPTTMVRFFCIMTFFSLLNLFYYCYIERSWRFLYGILYSYFSFLALLWIFPYALLTVRSRTWGTR
jgi:hyaluronan synthase